LPGESRSFKSPGFGSASRSVGVALPMLPACHSSSLERGAALAFRRPLQFIVISVMSVTFPYTYRVLYMTVNWWCVPGASCHRHAYRHGENGLDMRLGRYHDGDDARDSPLRRFSRYGGSPPLHRLFSRLIRSSPFQHPYIEVGLVMIDLQGYLRLGNLGSVSPRSSRA
jgi:hypothetical protein